VVLACEQGGGADERDLHPGHRRGEGRAQRDLGLAEADIAADQPVHRAASGEILDHIGDGAILIVGLVIGEAIDEGGIAPCIRLGDIAALPAARARQRP
jgi:hypothetical protein